MRKSIVGSLFFLLGLLPLLVFKYYDFVTSNIQEGLASIGLLFKLPGLNWAIPIGISFYSFQAVGYLLDVYYGRIKPEIDLLNYLLFVSFFPQIMSGPISKAEELLPQIKESHKFDYVQGRQGLKYLLWGMFIKLVIADRLGMFVDTVYANYIHYSGATCFVASIFYTFQIYCDFAGYSLMAIGVAKTLGFDLINNFRRPYLAISITEFWKRWHISLTRWFTMHIYIPLGGNRCGKYRTYWNVLVTFLISGLWHGANWTFIVWGGMHGLFQIAENFLKWQKYEGDNFWIKTFRIFMTFLLVNFAWIFFRMPNLNEACRMILQIFTHFGVPDLSDFNGTIWLMLMFAISILFAKDIHDEFFPYKFFTRRAQKLINWSAYVVISLMILSFGVLDGSQFIYVSF